MLTMLTTSGRYLTQELVDYIRFTPGQEFELMARKNSKPNLF